MKIADVSKLRGPLNELHDQLFGNNGEERLAQFKLWLKAATPKLAVWKTIKLGVHKTPDAYRQSILAQGNRIHQSADQILDKVTISKTETEIDLAVVTMANLGFRHPKFYEAIKERILEIGGQLCPNEVGPALRDQYLEQSDKSGEYDAIAMEPLTDSGDDPTIFSVDWDGRDRWLFADSGHPRNKWEIAATRFVVVVPRK